MSANWNWLQGMDHQVDGPARPQAVPVFAGQKLVVVGGSSGMGRQTAEDVVAAGGSAVVIGQHSGKVEDTVQTLAKEGTAWGITADLADRMQAERVCQQLAAEHPDATLLVNAAGLFVPSRSWTTTAPTTTPTPNWTGPPSSSPRPWPAAWSRGARAGPS